MRRGIFYFFIFLYRIKNKRVFNIFLRSSNTKKSISDDIKMIRYLKTPFQNNSYYTKSINL